MTCTRNFDLFFPVLMQNITITQFNLFSLWDLLKRGDHGNLVRSLSLQAPQRQRSRYKQDQLGIFSRQAASSSDIPPSYGSLQVRADRGMEMTMENVYDRLISLETLIVGVPSLLFSFRQMPHRFLFTSLKKLLVGLGVMHRWNLSARNVVWILLFCQSLLEVSLGLFISTIDYRFLVDHGLEVAGQSDVKKLALRIHFESDDSSRKLWWGSSEGTGGNENRKTKTISRLLNLTKDLQCLELFANVSYSDGPRNQTPLLYLSSNCLASLHRSFESLQHLRLLGISSDQGRPLPTLYSNFRNLRVLTIGINFLLDFVQDTRSILPPNVEILYLPCYADVTFEEALLASFLESRHSSMTKLKEVIVPKLPLLVDGETESIPSRELEVWAKNRRQLESYEGFKTGKVKLRKIDKGGAGESQSDRQPVQRYERAKSDSLSILVFLFS